ncbi:NADPH-dependent F420 reductase [Rhodococcus aetherivorans]|uniref:NADPH-dependent F420 reductase n=1 Tax=Rhodococcus aetherivorans TaxID=191292 RepID=UPI0016395A8D|nr:NAD(P)-binding domain-containing protein [Rhodococcus aetherivorans]MBC2592423.1 NAD(P)-binding domain-containing protein [Rhodococcus aetherivorans]
MKVGIIGTGNMGRALARRLVHGGHQVYVVGSTPEKGRALAQELGGQGPGTIEAAATRDAVATGCDILVLATWYSDSTRIAVELSDVVRDKVVVDIANPFNATFDGLITDYDTSAAEEIQRRLPGAEVVKAFNTTFAPVLADNAFNGTTVDVFLASDSDAAKARVAELVASTGLRPIDAGALRNSRVLERNALFMVELQGRYGLNFQAGLKVLPTHPLPFPARVSVHQ